MEHKRNRIGDYPDPSDYNPEEREADREYSPTPSRRRRREGGQEPTQTSRPAGERKRSPGTSAGSARKKKTQEEQKQPRSSSARERMRRRSAESDRKAEDTPTVLSERSVNAAKKRKEIREENARLSRLREQQKRQAKRRTVKRIDKGLFKRIIIMAGVIVAVILSMVIFFRVDTIQVEGAGYYSQEEILEVCGVSTGDNLLTLSRGEISGNIMAPLKYVESVKVSRQLPNTLIIRITESEPSYAVQDVEGNYFLMTARGRVVEPLSGNGYKEFTLVEGVTIEPPSVGENIRLHAGQGEETKAKGQLSAMQELLIAVEEASLGRHIASVQIPSAYKLSLWYEDRFLVELGDTTRLDYKLEYLKAVIEREESYVTGTIDLTLKDGDKAIIRREE